MLQKQEKRLIRHRRVRAKIQGTAKVPRLCVFRSHQYIYAQLIDDDKGKTMASVSGKANTASAKKVGELIAKKAKNLQVAKVVFDRGGYKYHGKVKAVAEGAREGGLKF
ncbi:MAG: 50S ribosomal protein L18 [Candidatus Nealsonbacteria bacterium RIFCSPLOWO2_01_FULL_43_32]|uniref:Large ribosomal subunit protein uL18 n=1 Tax=Candidatus Nealsonbacteria bacterium RIFCSPLOWO2_01_FULL_43_32 TaxID=1801672 RepID=A0A1G2EGY6_9BACT|nr:MAG: 50S ribosomal protein L18 [Candidatus Nealsonbacteria bacterium RIFCSPLOWO2_01_FULL_43_32]